jgi:DNA-binding response OmpR family regulator
MQAARVVVVGPAEPAAVARLAHHDRHALVADDVRHAVLLQRMVRPELLVFLRWPTDEELALITTTATAPIVVVAVVAAAHAVAAVNVGVARVVNDVGIVAGFDAAAVAAIAREGRVVRALAQLRLCGATGTLRVSAGGVAGGIVVDRGAAFTAHARGPDGESSGSPALALLAQVQGPVAVSFDDVDAHHDADVDLGAIAVGAADEPLVLDDIDVDVSALLPRHTPRTDDEIAALQRPRVLVVEDDIDLQRLYATLLRARGFDVDVADDGAAGFDAALAAPPDAILSDIMMPRTNGWDLLALVRNSARLRETPFLVLSHHHDMLQRLRGANCGADAYLEKSLRPDAVISAVAAAVRPLKDVEAALVAGAPVVDVDIVSVGPQTFLRLLARLRATARVTAVAGQAHVVIDVVDGACVHAHAGNGLVDRDAVRAALLLDAGQLRADRAAVVASPPQLVRVPLDVLCNELCGELEAVLDDVRTGALVTGQRLRLRPDLLQLARATATKTALPIIDAIVAALARGTGPREVIARPDLDPLVVDAVVRDLFRKGAIAP